MKDDKPTEKKVWRNYPKKVSRKKKDKTMQMYMGIENAKETILKNEDKP